MHDFVIERWAACAPGLESPAAWRAWAEKPVLPGSDFPAPPQVAAMPPMLRRRLNILGRTALTAAYAAQGDAPAMPVITASRHGDLIRSAQLLQSVAASEPVSPTDFSLSVFNAIAGLYSIASHHALPVAPAATCVACGAESAEVAMTEALAQLAEGGGPLLVLVYDAPLPEVYRDFAEGPECLFAWAWQVRARRPDEACYWSLRRLPEPVGTAPWGWPQALEVLRFTLGREASLHTGAWRWVRHA